MAERYDVVAIGSGHNGLVAAAYLAAAGKKTLVLERNAWFGGGVVTRELTVPGFRHDQHSMAHIFIQANPLLARDELGLKRDFGLEYVFPELPMMSVFEDGTTLGLYRDRDRTCAEIAKFSKRDAEAYRRLAEKAASYLPMVAASLYAPPAPLGATYALLDQSREGRELWRYMQMSSHDLLSSIFEHDKVRMHFARVAGENLVSPDEKATGFGVFVFVGFLEAYGIGVPLGGSGRLTDALVACIRKHGGEVLGDSDVARVVVRNGRAAGVETTDGRTYLAADAVIGALHPHDLPRMVDGLPDEVADDARATQVSDIGCITVHAALNAPLEFRAGPHVRAVMIELLPASYDTIRKSFDKLRYRELSDYPLVGLGSLTMFDPSRAPAGKATMHAWDYVTYDRADGRAWDAAKDAYVERMLTHMGKFIANLDSDNVIAYHSDSPVDMERTSSSFRRGDLHGIAATTYQYGAHRPTPDLGQNKVPGCERLYLVGPFQHPGGGVFGAGRAAAMQACADLGIDFDAIGARRA
ncbi:MAG TPA: NAD(P)/FAD-dependent oxidoreductase [Gammaproteobacteria bacterium]|nr:NAD(P)/FAD-dependent oxidoreductase [Gammaproteobacteria bacterium]